jgi:hypothetical protein
MSPVKNSAPVIGYTLSLRLDKAEQFKVMVSQLRTRLNDDIDFREHFETVVDNFNQSVNLTEEERFHALHEIWSVAKQSIGRIPMSRIEEIIDMVLEKLLPMEEVIDEQLRNIPPSLPMLRDQWHSYKIEIIKLKIVGTKSGISRSLMNELFSALKQGRAIWKDKGNAANELKSLIIICDEYVSYGVPLGPVFLKDYHDEAVIALHAAEAIVQERWPHPSMHEFAMGVANFSWAICGDRNKAMLWLDRFECLGISPLHYASWFRKQYADLKRALELKAS